MKNKLPVVFQSETVECGLAALVMILRYHGHDVRLDELRRLHPVNLSGISLIALVDIAKKNFLQTNVIRLEPDNLHQLVLPSILHWNMNHFVVLSKIQNDKFIVHDPGQGVRKLSYKEMAASFTGIALECFPTEGFQIRSLKKEKSLFHFIGQITDIKTILFKLMVFTFIYQIFLLILPRYLRMVIEKIIPSNNMQWLIQATLVYVVFRLLTTLAKIFKSCCLLKFDFDVNMKLGMSVFNHIMNLPLSYFEKRNLGDILHRFNSVEQLRQIITNGLVDGLWSGLIMLTTLFVMNRLYTKYAIITLCFAIIFVVFKWLMIKKQQMKTSEMLMARSKEQVTLIENIRGIQPIKVFIKENVRFSWWLKSYGEFLKTSYAINFIKTLFDNGKELLLGLELIFIIFLAAIDIMQQKTTIVIFYIYLFYRQQFFESLQHFVEKLSDYSILSIYAERLHDITHHPAEYTEKSCKRMPKAYSLSVKNLSFRYSDMEPYIFQHINFHVDAGECVAIIGPSGIGKSTLMKVMMGLLKPVDGFIAIDGISLDEIDQPRQYMASVMQDDLLLSGSIAQNIAFFATPLCMEKVYSCAKLAGIYAEMMRMPMRFDTLVGDMGTTLSGGQKQRILLARALYANPKIIFLDEATSHLDAMKESEVNRAIKSLGITCIMIAHREETIKMADRLITLEKRIEV